MNILYMMVPASLILASFFVGAFVWSVRSGQMDDTETPAQRILED